MHFRIETEVSQSAQKVLDGFNEDLFLALKPPVMPLELLRFDGCEKGDKVQLILGISPFSQRWNALVIEHGENDEMLYFTDIGEKLPFPIKDWKHRHQILKREKGAVIVDDITYTTGFYPLDMLMYPVMYLQFWMRVPVYRRLFK
ncbi:MAG: ligand-binding SRPBCC domain-containing protein [Maribacter sp.]|jgi:ligand-binding SRPBCC domain-containing protein